MFGRVFDRIAVVNTWLTAVLTLFSAVALGGAPDALITTQRAGYVFEHIAPRGVFVAAYSVAAVAACFAIVYPKLRWTSFLLPAVLHAFWSGASILPALLGKVEQGNLLGTIAGITLVAYGLSFAVMSYFRYNRKLM